MAILRNFLRLAVYINSTVYGDESYWTLLAQASKDKRTSKHNKHFSSLVFFAQGLDPRA